MRSHFKQKYLLILLLVLIFLGVVLRFVFLEESPPGFFIDESAGATNILCLSEDGTSEEGISFPLFFPEFGAFFTAPYVYFGAVWVKIFGYSISSLRAIPALFSVLTIVGIFFLSQLLFLNFLTSEKSDHVRASALLAATTAAVSPWSFQFSRIAWDPPLMPCFLIWGIYYLIKSKSFKDLFFAAVLFALAMYSYPTARIQVPIIIISIFILSFFQKKINSMSSLNSKNLMKENQDKNQDKSNKIDRLESKIEEKGQSTFQSSFQSKWPDKKILVQALFFFGSLFILVLPLLIKTLDGSLQGRFKMLSIFSGYYLDSKRDHSILFILETFIKNIYLHFSPHFLFFKGDSNLRHSTGQFGVLSWPEIFILLSGISFFLYRTFIPLSFGKKTHSWGIYESLILFLIVGILSGVLPSALTWEGVPHALRALGAWPFYSLLAGLIYFKIGKHYLTPFILISFIFSSYFFSFYFMKYPKISREWYDIRIKEAAIQAQNDGDWLQFNKSIKDYAPVSARYFLMSYGHFTCKQSLQEIQKAKN